MSNVTQACHVPNFYKEQPLLVSWHLRFDFTSYGWKKRIEQSGHTHRASCNNHQSCGGNVIFIAVLNSYHSKTSEITINYHIKQTEGITIFTNNTFIYFTSPTSCFTSFWKSSLFINKCPAQGMIQPYNQGSSSISLLQLAWLCGKERSDRW